MATGDTQVFSDGPDDETPDQAEVFTASLFYEFVDSGMTPEEAMRFLHLTARPERPPMIPRPLPGFLTGK